MGSWWRGVCVVLLMMEKVNFMIDDLIKQFFERYNGISSSQCYNKLFVSRTKTSSIKYKVRVTRWSAKSSQFISNLSSSVTDDDPREIIENLSFKWMMCWFERLA